MVCSTFPGPARGGRQEFVPLDHWVYDAIERFEALGLCDLPEDLPLTRPEFVRIVGQISMAVVERQLSARDRHNLSRLETDAFRMAVR